VKENLFIFNEQENKAIRKTEVKSVTFYKSKDKDSEEEHWIVYGRCKDEKGGFMFGKFETMMHAKNLYKKVLRELNT